MKLRTTLKLILLLNILKQSMQFSMEHCNHMHEPKFDPDFNNLTGHGYDTISSSKSIEVHNLLFDSSSLGEATPITRRSCCKVDYTDEIARKCEEDLLKPSPNDTAEIKDMRTNKVLEHLCIAECEFKRKGYLKNEDTIDFDAVKKDLAKRYPNPSDKDYVDLLEKSLHDCYNFARANHATMHMAGPCNTFPAVLLGCAYQQIIVNCPEKRWHESKKCFKMKDFLQNCNVLTLTKT